MACATARAEDDRPVEVRLCDRAHLLLPGEASNCRGLLVPELEAETALSCLVADLPVCKLTLDAARAEGEVRLAAFDALLAAERARGDAGWRAAKEASEAPAWYERLEFWLPAALVVGAAIGFLGGWGFSEALR